MRLPPGSLFVVVVWSIIKSVFFSRVCSALTMLSVPVCQLDKQTPLCITTCCHTEGRGRKCARVCVCVAASVCIHKTMRLTPPFYYMTWLIQQTQPNTPNSTGPSTLHIYKLYCCLNRTGAGVKPVNLLI